MDLVEYSQARFEEIRAEYLEFSKHLHGDIDIQIIPLSALEGDNVVDKSAHMDWYQGPSLLELLETVDVDQEKGSGEFRFPVQYVNRQTSIFAALLARSRRVQSKWATRSKHFRQAKLHSRSHRDV